MIREYINGMMPDISAPGQGFADTLTMPPDAQPIPHSKCTRTNVPTVEAPTAIAFATPAVTPPSGGISTGQS
jgi:hypothetical protein